MVEKTKWLTWYGENRLPVLPHMRVEIQFRNGDVECGHRADYWDWTWVDEEEDEEDLGGDIISYRVWHENVEEV